MSEPDSASRRRPPTIDLTAKEVETARADSTHGSTRDPVQEPVPGSAAARGANDGATGDTARRKDGGTARQGPSRTRAYAVGIVAGAVVVGAAAAGLWVADVIPRQESAAPMTAQAAKSPAVDEISSRLDSIQQALRAPRADEALTGRMTAAEAQAKSLGDSVIALTRRVDEVATAAQSALAQAKAATAAAQEAKTAAQASAQRGDLVSLANRIAALEGAVKSLTAEVAQRTARADDAAARATVAAEALRAAVERGAPFQAELDAAKLFGADDRTTAALAPLAADGVPTPAILGRELAALVPALQRASESEPAGGSLLGRLEARAGRLVRITPLDAAAAPSTPSGSDVASVIARLNADATRDDIAAALTDLARLPPPARTLADAWIKKAQAREAAVAASRRIAADALDALAKPAAQ